MESKRHAEVNGRMAILFLSGVTSARLVDRLLVLPAQSGEKPYAEVNAPPELEPSRGVAPQVEVALAEPMTPANPSNP